MNFNLKQTLSYCFSDNGFFKKLLTGCAFLALSMVINRIIDIISQNPPRDLLVIWGAIALAIVAIIIALFPYGYEIENAHSRLIQDEIALCNWENKAKKLKYGFLSCLIPCLSWGVLMIVIGIVFCFIIGLLQGLIYKVFGALILKFFTAIVLSIFAMFLIFTIALIEASRLSYIIDLNFKSFFNMKTIKKIMVDNFRKYANYFGNIIILGFLQIAALITIIIILALISQFVATVLSALFLMDDISKQLMYILCIFAITPVIMYFYFVYIKAQFLKMITKENEANQE